MIAVLVSNPITTVAQQRWWIETGVSVRGEASSNPDFAPKGQEQSDFWLGISPSISFAGQSGGRVQASGNLELGAAFGFRGSSGTEANVFARPQGNLNALFQPTDHFFIDTGLSVQRSIESPFLARPDTVSTYNTSSAYQARVSPYFKGLLGDGVEYTVRSDNSWTDSSTESGQYSGRHFALIERAPQPLGGSLSIEHTEVSSNVTGQGNRTSDLARAVVRYAPVPDLAVGLRGGTERNNYVLANLGQWQSFYGVDMTWRPTERTVLDGYWEDRYFGSSWNAVFSHRMPRLAVSVQSSRNVVTTSEQFLTLPGLANLFSLLDASLTTRVPDPIERRRIIVDFLSRQQFPQQLLTPVVVFNDRMSVETRSSASAVYLGARHSLAMAIYRLETVGLAGVRNQLPSSRDDNIQHGAELTFSHNLTPSDTLSATGRLERTESLPSQAIKRETTQKLVRLQVNTKLGAWTYGYFGGRYQWIDSNVTNDAREAAVFASFDYRF